MARNKKLLMREIKQALEQALHVVNSVEDNPDGIMFEEARTAASSAQSAASNLHRLAGMLDVESDQKGK